MFKFLNTLIACLFVRGFSQFSSLVVRLPRYMRNDLATKSKKWLSQLIFHFSLKVSYYVYIIRNVFTRWSKRLKNISFSFFIKCGRKTKYTRNAILSDDCDSRVFATNYSKMQGHQPRRPDRRIHSIEKSVSIDVAGIVSFGLSVRNGQAAGGPATRPNTHRELLIL